MKEILTAIQYNKKILPVRFSDFIKPIMTLDKKIIDAINDNTNSIMCNDDIADQNKSDVLALLRSISKISQQRIRVYLDNLEKKLS